MTRRLLSWINLSGICVFVALLAIWQVVIGFKLLQFDYLPTPGEVIDGFGELVKMGTLWSTILHTLFVAFVSAVMAIVMGVVFGFVIALVPTVRNYTMGSIDVLRTLPTVALMPVAMLIWGPITKTEIIVTTYSSLWPILINSAGGVSNVNSRLVEVARVFRIPKMTTYRKIILPAALPAILVGARLTIIHALIVAIVAEILINPQGLGGALLDSQNALQPAQMWAWVIVAAVIGWLLNALLVTGVRHALPGGGANVGVSNGAAL